MITVESTEAEVRVTIPKGEFPEKRLRAFLDWIRLEGLAGKSQLTEAVADDLAEEMKADWWAKNRHRFVSGADG